MPISTLSQTPAMQRPCRVFIDLDLKTLREYDPSILPWQFTDSASSLLRKSKDVVTRITNEVHTLLFGSDVAVPEIHYGLRGYKDERTHATVEHGYDYSFEHDTCDTPILQFTSHSVQDKQLLFNVEQLDDRHREFINREHAEDLAWYNKDPESGQNKQASDKGSERGSEASARLIAGEQ